MAGLVELEKVLMSLLQQHECVVIPRFGAFLIRHAAASANPFNGEIKPSGNTLFFNPSVQNDDGLLMNELKKIWGCDYASAATELQSVTDNIVQTADLQRICKFGNLGNFFVNAEGKIMFLPQPTLNLSRSSFGLPVLNVSAGTARNEAGETRILQETPEIQTVQETEVHEEAIVVDIQETDRPRRRSSLWKAAAVVSFMSMSIGGGFLLMNKLERDSEQQLASSIPMAVKKAKTVLAEKNANDSVYLSVIKDMNAYMHQLKTGKGFVFICGGSHMDKKLAQMESKRWLQLGIPSVMCKKQGSSLIKVMLGRFETEKEASEFLAKMPGNSGYSAGILIAELNLIEP